MLTEKICRFRFVYVLRYVLQSNSMLPSPHGRVCLFLNWRTQRHFKKFGKIFLNVLFLGNYLILETIDGGKCKGSVIVMPYFPLSLFPISIKDCWLRLSRDMWWCLMVRFFCFGCVCVCVCVHVCLHACVCSVCRCVWADPTGGVSFGPPRGAGPGQRRTQNVRFRWKHEEETIQVFMFNVRANLGQR